MAQDSAALSLAYASVGDDGCTAIARYMRENVMLRTLDLRGNNIRADGLVVLAHGLRSGGSNMTSVCFKWNQIGSHPRGVQALCDVLKDNESITHVDLRNNKIGADCGAFLGDMLRHNSTVTHLDLSWNDLGIEGGKAILDGMQANHSLIDCQLSGNRIAEDTLHAIAFILRRNRQTAPMGASTFRQERGMTTQDPTAAGAAAASPSPTSPASPGVSPGRSTTPASPGFGSTARSVNMNVPSEAAAPSPSPKEGPATSNLPAATPAKVQPPVHDEAGSEAVFHRTATLKLLQREQNHSNAEDARFFGEVAEYIDLLQLDVARNKKYRMDAEER
ncbi:Leucine-rich repeat-containing protein 45 [Durusdinium trenchii]|uniref:Leucine-rich repeat-containing protein 45 n=1 Tax=Durusdinium trenchii TaxID=1381693 RepID=A0ABP0J6X6_9DINO